MPFEQLGVPAELRRVWPVNWGRIDGLNEIVPHVCWDLTFEKHEGEVAQA